MSQSDSYFQFPLCALAFGANSYQRLRYIVSYSMVEAGRALYEKLSDESRRLLKTDPGKEVCRPRDLNPKLEHHWSLVTAMNCMNVPLAEIAPTLEEHARLERHVNRFAETFGRDPLVRIRTDILFDAMETDGKLSYRDLAVFAAIVSVIGSAPYARVSRETIKCRMGGYKTAAVQKQMIDERLDTAEWTPLTDKQIRTTVDRLYRRKLITKSNPSRTQALYSIRMSPDELDAAVETRMTASEAFRQEHAKRSARLQERIRKRKEEQAEIGARANGQR